MNPLDILIFSLIITLLYFLYWAVNLARNRKDKEDEYIGWFI